MNAPGWLNRFIERRHRSLTILTNVLLVLVAAWAHSAIGHWSEFAVAGTLLLALGFFDYYERQNHDRMIAPQRGEDYINGLLEAASVSLLRAARPRLNHLRVNVMYPDENVRYLSIRYSFGFDRNDLDRDIKCMVGTGCAGQAWVQRKPVVADFEVQGPPGMPHWGLPDHEAQKIRPGLKSCFSLPIFEKSLHIYAPDARNLIAILSFDSDNLVKDIGFEDKQIQELAYCFATVLEKVFQPND